jgi:formate/nitrite transporter FocA (FNT family)
MNVKTIKQKPPEEREEKASGVAAGISMGFSMIAEGLLQAHLPHSFWAPLITKLGYAAGFLIVVLGRQELFTEQTLSAVLPLLSRAWSPPSLTCSTRRTNRVEPPAFQVRRTSR